MSQSEVLVEWTESLWRQPRCRPLPASNISVTRNKKEPNDERISEGSLNARPGAELYVVRFWGSTQSSLRELPGLSCDEHRDPKPECWGEDFFTVDAVNGVGVTASPRVVGLRE
jgi:hypothetical protein